MALLDKVQEWWWYARNGYRQMAMVLGYGQQTAAGVTITEDVALSCSVIWACSKKLAEDVGSLPLNIRRNRADGSGSEVAQDHPLQDLLHNKANPSMTAMQFRETMQLWLPNTGNAFARVERSGGRVVALWPIHPSLVRTQKAPDGRGLTYQLADEGSKWRNVMSDQILHLRAISGDGFMGMGIIHYAKDTIGNAIRAERHLGKFLASGGRLPGIVKVSTTFKNEEERKEFRKEWNDVYKNPEDPFQSFLLQGDVDYKQLGISHRDAQLLEARQFSIPELCRWYLMPPHMIQDLTHATFSNIEHQDIGYSKHTLRPWCVRWEQAINAFLLGEVERRRGFYAKFNMQGIERGDFKTRTEGYAQMLQNGVMNPDMICDLEDIKRPPNGAGAAYHIQLNMQTLPGTGEPTTAEAASLAKLQAARPSGAGTEVSNE